MKLTTFESAYAALNSIREHVARSSDKAWSIGWQDGAEVMADVDSVIVGLEFGRPLAFARACHLLSRTGPLRELSVIGGWEDAFDAVTDAGESRIAAQ